MKEKSKCAALVLVLIAVWMHSESSFVDGKEVLTEKGDDNKKNIVTTNDNRAEAKSKDKKAGEDIMFGNQQNRGIMEELANIADRITRPGDAKSTEDKNDTESKADEDEQKLEEALQDDKKDSEEPHDAEDVLQSGLNDVPPWEDKTPMDEDDALQYLLNNGPVEPLPSTDDEGGMYDQEVYRRKRQPASMRRRRRSLRKTLEQMMQTRTRRLPRRSMRYKREVDMEDILAYLGKNDPNRSYYNNQSPRQQQSYSSHAERQFRYPYTYGRMVEPPEEQEEQPEGKEEEEMEFPPFFRFADTSNSPFSYTTKNEEPQEQEEAYPEWMEGITAPQQQQQQQQPSIFSVSRRSSPLFYPIDYRYIPGFKKRKRSMATGSEDPEDVGMFGGKWGRVVQAPSAYASAEDVAKLYALADMLTDGEYSNERKRQAI